MGTPFVYDPGDGFLSGEALQSPPPFAHARSAVVHDGLARNLVTRLKYGDRTELASFMADWMVNAGNDILADCDLIVPVPLHFRRFLTRHYNQAAELSRYIAKKTGKDFRPDVLKRHRYTRQQVGLRATERHKNVKGAFTVPKAGKTAIKGKNIILVDDVFTTGATVRAATTTLCKAGAHKVSVLTFSRVLTETADTCFT